MAIYSVFFYYGPQCSVTPASEAVLRCSTPASEAVLGHPSTARTKHFPGSLSIQRLGNILNLASAKRRSEKSNDQPTGGEKAGRGGGEKEGKERTVVQNSQELGHSLVRSFVRSHRSLIRLLRTARFVNPLRCAHSFARSLTHLRARGKVND